MSIAAAAVDNIGKRPTGLEIPDSSRNPSGQRRRRTDPGNMRRDRHLRTAPERACPRQRLLFQNIKSRSGERAVVKRCHDVPPAVRFAAPRVDQHRAAKRPVLRELCKKRAVDKAACGIGQRQEGHKNRCGRCRRRARRSPQGWSGRRAGPGTFGSVSANQHGKAAGHADTLRATFPAVEVDENIAIGRSHAILPKLLPRTDYPDLVKSAKQFAGKSVSAVPHADTRARHAGRMLDRARI